MADSSYFETDDITKEYDSKIVRRILSFLSPYKKIVFITLTALVISTAGDLFIPVLQQQIIDSAILARFFAFNAYEFRQKRNLLSDEALADYEYLTRMSSALTAGDMIFVMQNRQTIIRGSTEEEMKSLGILSDERWYAFSPDTNARFDVINRNPGLFLLGPSAAILNEDLYSLPVSDIIALRSPDISLLIRGSVLLVVMLLLVFIFTFCQTFSANLMTQRVMKDIRLGLFKKTINQSSAFLSRHPVGRIVTRLTGDVETMDEFFTTVLVAFLKDIFIMAGTIAVMFFLSAQLAAAVLITLPPVLLITLISRYRARDAFRAQRTASSKVFAYLAERLAGIQVVQLFGQEKKSSVEFNKNNRELLDANIKEMYVFATFRPLVEWFSTLTVAVVIVIGSRMVLSLSVSLGVLIAFINLVQMFFNPVMDIAEKYTMLQSAMAGGEKVFKLMDTDEQIQDTGQRERETGFKGEIEFDNVRFAYKEGEDVLKGLSFTVKPGETAAIVGYTGAGKTTIINVLSRLWDIDSGEIRLDGIPIKDIPLSELRKSIMPVMQDVTLFSGTVEENISLGLDLSEEKIIEAAKAAYAHDFINALPEGYKTHLSEGAANISAGQRQLLSFARVIAHNPQVVILDEATSSIDTETEKLIQLGLKKVLAGRTSFVIAHRLSTIKDADRIMVLSSGRLTEEGSHDELVKKNGLYALLYRLQYSSE